MIILIAAIAQNNALGLNNKMIWHLPNDFKRFKSLTTGNHIVMGRKTFESLPKMLPNRTHVVISRQESFKPEGCIMAKNIEDAIAKCPIESDIYIIGGGEIYKQTLSIAHKLELTRVHHDFEADVFFPEIDSNDWELITNENFEADEKHQYGYSFETYSKKPKHHN
jgi:dihydrofolate reductase